MNDRIRLLAEQAGSTHKLNLGVYQFYTDELEKFAELIVEDHAKKTIQGLMSDPAFVQAMDEYYEQKWSHRFD